MKDILWIFAFILVLGGAVTAYKIVIAPKQQAVEQPVLESRERNIPIIRHPVPVTPTNPERETLPNTNEEVEEQVVVDAEFPEKTEQVSALPVLDKSDALVLEVLVKLVDDEDFRLFFNIDEIIRRFVVTIDNLSRKTMPRKLLITKSITGIFLIEKEKDDYYLHGDNFKRYQPLAKLAESVNLNQLATIYIRFYPLFQEAYEDLGYPSDYFNDRLIEVIDHLLSTPRITQQIKLTRPRILYRYADPELEKLSSGQKILIRIGPDNADRIKNRLGKIRDLLTQ